LVFSALCDIQDASGVNIASLARDGGV